VAQLSQLREIGLDQGMWKLLVVVAVELLILVALMVELVETLGSMELV
jgi:hypothetical protein